MKVLLLSDIEKSLKNSEVHEFIIKNLKNKSILFIPSTPLNEDITDKNVTRIIEFFKQKNIRFDIINVLRTVYNPVKLSEYIGKHTLIYFMGGDTEIQNQFINKLNLKEILIDYDGIIIGQSAGAINLCDEVFLNKKHLDIDRSIKMKGIGLIQGVSIDVHFDVNDNLQIQELKKNSLSTYCIPDKSAIIFDGKFNFINDIYLLEYNLLKKVN